jgi:hypothetical protein
MLISESPVLSASESFFLLLCLLLDSRMTKARTGLAFVHHKADELVNLFGVGRGESVVAATFVPVQRVQVSHEDRVLVFIVIVKASLIRTAGTMVVAGGFMALQDK